MNVNQVRNNFMSVPRYVYARFYILVSLYVLGIKFTYLILTHTPTPQLTVNHPQVVGTIISGIGLTHTTISWN